MSILVIISIILLAAVMWFRHSEQSAPGYMTNAEIVGTDAKELNILVKELTCKRDNLNIYGEIYLPGDGTGVYPTVIIAHEFGVTHDYVAGYAREFAKAGYAAYVFDFNGAGRGSKSDGKSTEMSAVTEKKDMEAAIDMLKQQPFVDTNQIFLMGNSQGGLVAALTALERQSEIQGLILFYPALWIPDMARSNYSSIDAIPQRINVWGERLGKCFYEDVYDIDIYSMLGEFEKDVLIVQGDRDRLVDYSISERAAREFPSATLKRIPGAGHVFYGSDFSKAAAYAVEYLNEQTTKNKVRRKRS